VTDQPRLPPAYNLVALDEVDSTNDEARRLIERENATEGTLVWARAQRSGRGRRGKHWASPPGNLYLSLVVRPACPPRQAAQLSFVAALALGDALAALVPKPGDIAFKWPNDVLFGGRKVAGILLESSTSTPQRLDWLVVGVGVNVASSPDDTRVVATSLHAEGCEATAAAVLEGFAHHYLEWSERWRADGFAPVREAWLRRAAGRGQPVTVDLESEHCSGRFADLDGAGALVVELAGGGRRKVNAGEVYFGAAP